VVTLLDAYALVAFLADEPAAAEVETLIRAGDTAVLVVNLTEALDVSQRVHGVSEAELRDVLEPLLGDLVSVTIQREDAAWRAAALRAKYCDRRSRPLSLADCLLLAAANGDAVATADHALAAVLRAERTALVPLPDSTGTRP
jgi:PIN domain nuclease of toxin-antitoxin system